MAQSRGLYLRVGVLVLAGLALGIGFILFLTANRIGSRNTLYESYFRESVQGLEIGASVRFRGVAIGRVAEIGLVSAEYRDQRPETERAPFRLVYVRFAVDERKTGETDSVDVAIAQGLRVRIAAQGITGVNYLELDFVDPNRFPVPDLPWEPRFTVIPAIPSTVAQVQNAAENILAKLQEADLPKLMDDTIGLVSDLRAQVKDGNVAIALREAAALLTQLRGIADKADLPGMLAEIRRAASEVPPTLGEFRRSATDARELLESREVRQMVANVGAAAAELKVAAARLPGSIQAVDSGLRTARAATTDVQAELAPIMRDLRAAVSNLRDLTEQLRRSPSQTIFGAPPPAEPRR
jgi:ABC-type transporter Mla subunit MlaD